MDITILGIPYALDYRQAAGEDTPAAFRAAGLDKHLNKVTGGDVSWRTVEPELPQASVQNRLAVLCRAIAEAVSEERLRGRFPLIIAGDCMSSIGAVAGLKRETDDVAAIWFDAHGDFNTWETTPSGYLGGMPLAMLVGLGEQTIVQGAGIETPLREENVILTDARDLDAGEAEALAASSVHHLPNVKRLLSYPYPHEPIYVHLDVDVIDSKELPAVDFPTPGGPDINTMRRILQDDVAKGNLSVVTLASLNIARDIEGESVRVAIELLTNLFGPMAELRSRRIYPWWLYDDDANLDQELAAEYDARREALIKKIKRAFGEVWSPERNEIFLDHDPDSYQPILSDFIDRFPVTHWKNFDAQAYGNALSIFTPAAYRAYLAAYMIAVLVGSETLIDEELVMSFSGKRFYRPNLLEGLSRSQLQAVLEFIEFYDLMWDEWEKKTYAEYLEEASKVVKSFLDSI